MTRITANDRLPSLGAAWQNFAALRRAVRMRPVRAASPVVKRLVKPTQPLRGGESVGRRSRRGVDFGRGPAGARAVQDFGASLQDQDQFRVRFFSGTG